MNRGIFEEIGVSDRGIYIKYCRYTGVIWRQQAVKLKTERLS